MSRIQLHLAPFTPATPVHATIVAHLHGSSAPTGSCFCLCPTVTSFLEPGWCCEDKARSLLERSRHASLSQSPCLGCSLAWNDLSLKTVSTHLGRMVLKCQPFSETSPDWPISHCSPSPHLLHSTACQTTQDTFICFVYCQFPLPGT